MRRHHIFLLATAALVLVAVLAASGRLGNFGFQYQDVLKTLSAVHAGWVAIALCLLLVSCFVRAVRWFVLIRPAAPRARVSDVFTGTIIGFAAVVLFGRPGELVRPYLIGRRTSSPFSTQAAAWVLERIWDLLAVILIFGCALSQLRVDANQLGEGLQWVLRTGGSVAFGLAIAAIVAIAAVGMLSEPMQAQVVRAVRKLPAPIANRLEGLVISFLTGMAGARRWSQIGALAGFTALEWMVISAQTYAILHCFPASAHLGVVDSLVFLGFVAFGSVVQVPGIGGGVQVAAAVVLTELFGVRLEVATGVAIGYWLLSWAVLVPIGLVLAMATGVSWRSLRRMEEPEPTAGDAVAPSSAKTPVHSR